MSMKGYVCQDCGSQEPEHVCSELAKAELRVARNTCPLCRDPLSDHKDVIENIHIGRVHLSCILLHAITKPGPLGPL